MKEEDKLLKEMAKKLPKDFKGYMESEKLLKEDFHDSHIINVVKEKESLSIIFDMDTYISPGKPFGILRIIIPKNHESFLEFEKESPEIIVSNLEIIRKRFWGRTWPVIIIECPYNPPNHFEIICSNFWFERVEKYKSEKPIDISAPFEVDMKNFHTN